MSDDSKTVPPKQRSFTGYGPVATVGFAGLIFILPQVYTGLLVVLLGAVGVKLTEGTVGGYFAIDLIVQLFTLVMLALVLRGHKRRVRDLFGKLRAVQLLLVPVALVAYFAALIIALSLVQRLLHQVNLNQDQVNPFKAAQSKPELVIAFVALVIITPIIEELVFRGFLYRGLKSRLPVPVAAIIASGLFALAHGQLNVGIDVFILSLFLIALLEKTHSLVPSILLHATKNLAAFIAIFHSRF